MNERIRGFDGLRAIAVLLVFLHHKALSADSGLGHLGVWIFFALSGFLIIDILTTQRRYIDARATTFSAELKRFLYRRTLRIFPIYYLLLITLAVLMTMGFAGPELAGGMPYHFFYLSNFWIADVLHGWPGRYSHLWSLSIEEQFYLVFAPMLLAVRASWHMRICGAVVLIGMAALYVMKSTGDTAIVIYTHPLTNFWLLALGGMGGALIRRAPWFKRVLSSLPVVFLLTACVALLCVQEPGWERADDALQFTVSYVFYGACITLLVCAVASSARNALLVRWLEAKPLVSLGRISYGFYLYHAFIPDFTRSPRINALFGAEGMPWWARALCIVAAFLLTFALAKLSWHFIEAPILKLKDRRFTRSMAQRSIEPNGARFTESP